MFRYFSNCIENVKTAYFGVHLIIIFPLSVTFNSQAGDLVLRSLYCHALCVGLSSAPVLLLCTKEGDPFHFGHFWDSRIGQRFPERDKQKHERRYS